MDDFHSEASELIDGTMVLHKEMQSAFQDTVKSFAEDEQKAELAEFFGTFAQFMAKIEEARKQNIELKRKLEEEERKKAAAEAEAARKVCCLRPCECADL